jgi:hypothetical protein
VSWGGGLPPVAKRLKSGVYAAASGLGFVTKTRVHVCDFKSAFGSEIVRKFTPPK